MAALLRGAGPAEQATAARILSALAAQPALRAEAAAGDTVAALCGAVARAVAAAAARPGRRLRRRLVLAPAAAANMCALLGALCKHIRPWASLMIHQLVKDTCLGHQAAVAVARRSGACSSGWRWLQRVPLICTCWWVCSGLAQAPLHVAEPADHAARPFLG